MLAAVLGPVMQISFKFVIAIIQRHHANFFFFFFNDSSGQTPLLVVFSGGINQSVELR